ncbi:hypothetical protein OPQ81_009069 [Rhizoctonia solani]|nr:hypothetical protein OPQ81_009069 [Rhizoctonia solani]
MAGGHASSRVDSGSMKFLPGVSIRRPNVPPSSARPTPSGSVVPPTPSKQQININQTTPTHDHLADSSDTEPGPSSRGTIPLIMTRTGPPGVSITPGISRAQSRPFQPPRLLESQTAASASQATGPLAIPIPTVRPTVITGASSTNSASSSRLSAIEIDDDVPLPTPPSYTTSTPTPQTSEPPCDFNTTRTIKN